ncbi:hypothetical protein [Cohnella caldifontis]|uniref:hypothetical protein n=1 Tax=Cohnella caldifontis TaxID=3027471 RepID=UPI0023ED5790|nr:hypothetical protein [Cohnella sp. YIM B05605]
MPQEVMKPMGIGRMLDLTFRLYRKHFSKLVLILLICYGPFYLVQAMTQDQTSVQSILDIQGIVNDSSGGAEPIISEDNGGYQWAVVLTGLLFLVLTPVVLASVVFLVHGVLQGEEAPSALRLLRQSLKRFWGLLGSSIVFGLIVLGLFLVVVIVFTIVGAISSVSIFGMGGGSAASGAFAVILIALLVIGIVLGLYYFVFRFMYYLPFVAFKEASVGIGSSWSLTRRSFWRMFVMFFVLLLLIYLFNLVVVSLLLVVPMNSVLFVLLQVIVTLISAPIAIVAYAVGYHDLKVRDGMGLEQMIGRIAPGPSATEPQAEQP